MKPIEVENSKGKCLKQARKVKCPYCNQCRTQLPRHIRMVHKLTSAQAKATISNYGLRKAPLATEQQPKRKRNFVRRMCPVECCFATPARIHNHLSGAPHHIPINSVEYRKYLKMATPVLEAAMVRKLVPEIDSSDSDDSEQGLMHIDEPVKPTEDQMIVDEIRVEAKGLGIIDMDIYNSEEDEEFLLSEESESDVGNDSRSDHNDCASEDGNSESERLVNDGKDGNNEGNKETDHILKEFFDWMQTIDGGEKEQDNANQNVRQVMTILEHVDKEKNIRSLLDRTTVRDKWLVPFKSSSRKPGTVRSYCNSLRLMAEFLEISKLVPLPLRDIRALQTQSRAWSRGLNRIARRREHKKVEDDYDLIFDPAKLQQFQKSEPCKEALLTLERYGVSRPGLAPSQKEYCLVRDFLLWNLSLNNGGRPGPLMDITLNDMKNWIKKVINNGESVEDTYVIPIYRHKTDQWHGPSQLVFNVEMKKWFEVFVKNIRGKFYGLSQEGSSQVFLAHTGNPMCSKNVSGRLSSLWGKGFKIGNAKMNNTLIRKSVTTHIHKHHQELKQDVADKMCHKLETADKFYNTRRKGEKACETSQKIVQIFKSAITTEVSKKIEEVDVPKVAESCTWSEEDVALLNSIFSDYIEEGEISMQLVRKRVETEDKLQRFAGNIKRLVDKLRHIVLTTEKSDIANLATIPKETLDGKLIRTGIIDFQVMFTCFVEIIDF